ncbi:Hypothetical predicted protein [Xyrichtys novacula]|uniref:Uncharacterized protein n=1 Tax=Xyrichtys novacula TaxID=13765 RepID=A0AAV1FBD9_XYRNO|nr:Hypothetical predicted protein [Xyrichtys novacula]
MAGIHPTPAGTRRAGAAGTDYLIRTDDRYQPGVDRVQRSQMRKETRSHSISPQGNRGRSSQESFSFHQLAAAFATAAPTFTPGKWSESAAKVSRYPGEVKRLKRRMTTVIRI